MAASNLQQFINYNVQQIISGLEKEMYNRISQESCTDLLGAKHNPLVEIYKDLHEVYFTNLHNQLIQRNDPYDSFDIVSKSTSHSIYCLLNVLSQITPYVHFNFNRKNLQITTLESYVESVNKEIHRILLETNLDRLTNHNCIMSDITQRKILTGDSKFLNITIGKKN